MLNGKVIHYKKYTFFKYCEDCGRRYHPTGRKVILCDKCHEKRFMHGVNKRRYTVNRKKYLSLIKKAEIKDVIKKRQHKKLVTKK